MDSLHSSSISLDLTCLWTQLSCICLSFMGPHLSCYRTLILGKFLSVSSTVPSSPPGLHSLNQSIQLAHGNPPHMSSWGRLLLTSGLLAGTLGMGLPKRPWPSLQETHDFPVVFGKWVDNVSFLDVGSHLITWAVKTAPPLRNHFFSFWFCCLDFLGQFI